MKFETFKKLKSNLFSIKGKCSFCKNVEEFEIEIYTMDHEAVKNRSEDKGAVFVWSSSGVNKSHVILFLEGKLDRLKKMKWFGAGFPRLMLACPKCFRRKENE